MKRAWCLLLSGCATGAASGPLVPATPTVASACHLGAQANSVLVTEWAGAEKANLQAMLTGGAIAVAFSGCEMRLLPQCRLAGQYFWQRTTVASDRIEIKNEAELYAKLPLGALSLSGELKKSGELAVETMTSGQARLQGMDPGQITQDPACADATHIVNAVSMGAFTLSAGGEEGSKADLSVKGIGTNGKLGQSAKIVRGAGQTTSCSNATDQAPAQDCASPIEAFLTRIPGRGEPEAPPGTVPVDFVSTSETLRWDIYINDNAACTTPCSKFVDPSRPIVLRSREDKSQQLTVEHVLTGVGPVQIAGQPRQQGKFVTGISFLGLGGGGVFIGGMLALAGAMAGSQGQEQGSGLKTAGEWTAGISLIFVPVGLYLLLTSGARADQHPRYGPNGAVFTF